MCLMHINAIASYVTCPLKILSDNILLIYIINSRKLANLYPKIPIAWVHMKTTFLFLICLV